jgi:hypothetical protein
MGKKLDEAYYRLVNETDHYLRLAQTRGTEYDNGLAEGFAEALRLVSNVRNGLFEPVPHEDIEVVGGPARLFIGTRGRRARGRRGIQK